MPPLRPAFHISPPMGWLNDPNGLIQRDGVYHVFYQYNPFGHEWGRPHWGHATSRDLASWRHFPIALAPDRSGPDSAGCYSGCAVDDGGIATFVYTGVSAGPERLREVTCLARGSDDLLAFHKDPANPVIGGPPDGAEVEGFRDPFVWRDGDRWLQLIGSGRRDGGVLHVYESADLLQWRYLGELLHRSAAATTPVGTGRMWECPLLLRFPEGDLVVVSVWNADASRRRVVWFSGLLDGHRFVPARMGLVDVGPDFYAPAVMHDAAGRRLLWGWSPEGQDTAAARLQGWAGTLTVPRSVTLGADLTPRYAPVPELQQLRRDHAEWHDLPVAGEQSQPLPDVVGARLELVIELELATARAVGLAVLRTPDRDEETLIVYDAAEGRLVVDRRRSSRDPAAHRLVSGGPLVLSDAETLRLHVLVDGSIVEVVANDRCCLTARAYPTRDDAVTVGVLAVGGTATALKLDCWTLHLDPN